MILSFDGSDLYACMDSDSLILTDFFQNVSCSFIQLTAHKNRGKLQNCHFTSGFSHLPGSFQPKNTSTDDCHMFYFRQKLLDLLRICETANCNYFRFIVARNRRNKALRSCSIDQFCIFQFHSIAHNDFFIFHVDRGHFFSEQLNDIIFLIPGGFLDCNLICIQICHDRLGQHRTVIRTVRFIGDHDHGTCLIPFPDCLSRIQAGCAISDNYIEIFRIIGITNFLCFYRNKVLFAHSADRAYFHGGIENFTAYQTFHQCTASGSFLRIFFLLQNASKIITIIISINQVILTRFEADTESVNHFHTQLFETLNNMWNTFAAPAITSESTCQLSAVGSCENRGSKIPDGFQCLSHDSRCSEQNTICKSQFFQNFCLVCRNHIIAAHINITAVFDTFRNFLCQQCRISISTYIRNNNGLFRIWIYNRTPFFIGIHNEIQSVIQHRTMSRADHGKIQFSHSCQGFQHVGLERTDNTVEIILGSTHVPFMVCHLAYQNIMESIMRPEGITGHQNLFFFNIGIHGIRPVQIRHYHKTKCLIPDLHFLIVFYRNRSKLTIYNFFQETDGTACSNNLQPRVQFQKLFHTSRMIRFCVIYDQIINLCHIRELFQ